MSYYREKFNRAVGVVAEFDPFHRGHRYLLEEIRRREPSRGVICVMSGLFTQRGSAASADKLARAEMALLSGADLVLELPLTWATASAERFARGGIQVLADTGVVDAIAFGSESGDLSPLSAAAQALDRPEFSPLLRSGLEQGLSYAAARQQAVGQLAPGAEVCLSLANNNLGVEYLRALRHLDAGEIRAMTIPRQGADHGSMDTDSPMVSATRVRAWMAEGNWAALEGALPPAVLSILLGERDRGRCPALLNRCGTAILAQLRRTSPEELTRLPDWEPGLENRLSQAAQRAVDLAGLYDLAKTRRYPEARIRRMVLWAFLGLTAADRQARVPYLRVLGANGAGRELLHEMKGLARLPILTKPAQVRQLGKDAQRAFALECRAADLWALCLPDQAPGEQEWRRSPVILP